MDGATITTTPDLQQRFIRMSNNESSGSTGGSDTHTHTVDYDYSSPYWFEGASPDGHVTVSSGSSLPSYYELVFFIKVK